MLADYVQFGCGLNAPSSWQNFDASPTLRVQLLPIIGKLFKSRFFVNHGFPLFSENVEYGDIVKGLPVPLDSFQAVYCSHVLEHLSLEDVRTAIQNTHSYLKMGGVFRLVLPDLEFIIQQYVESNDTQASIQFMMRTGLGKQTRPRGIHNFVRDYLGNRTHLWMWDFKGMMNELDKVGFKDIRRATIGDSGDPIFDDVESPERWENCLGIHCTK